MSNYSYSGWAVQLINGKFANDSQGAVGPALFATRREAQAWWNAHKAMSTGGRVVAVTVSVREKKPK